MSHQLPTGRRRWWSRLALLVVAAALLLGTLAAWRAWHVRAELTEAQAAAARLQTAIESRDIDAAREALSDLQEHGSSAASQTSGPVWRAATHLPLLGSDARVVSVMSNVLAELAHDGLPPLVDIGGQLEDGTLAPRDGRVPVDRIVALQAPVDGSSAAFEEAKRTLAELPQADLGRLADAQEELGRVVADAQRRLASLRTAIRTLPPMLGADGPRRYLLALQNNAEIRSTGGFPGSTFVLVADDGRLRLDRSVPSNSFPILDSPALPLTGEEKALFPPVVGTMMVNANRIPDFPRAADLWLEHWRLRFGERLDGVVSTDPVMLSYLLEGQPALEVQGVRLDSANVVDELLSGTYARLEDPQAQDAFFQEVGREVFSRVLSVDDPQRFLEAVRRGADEGRLRVRSTDRQEQRVMEDAGLAGQLSEAGSRRPQVGVYVNDATGSYGSKMSYYLDYRAEVTVHGCAGGRQELTGALEVASQTPDDPTTLPLYVTGGTPDVPLGAQDLEIYLLGPRAGELGDVALDGVAPPERTAARYHGRPAVRVKLRLQPGQRSVLRWSMRSGTGQPGSVIVDVTPSIQRGTESSTVPPAC